MAQQREENAAKEAEAQSAKELEAQAKKEPDKPKIDGSHSTTEEGGEA